MLKAFVIICLTAYGYSIPVKFSDCGSKGATIHSIDLSPCTSEPCVIHGGTNYTAHVNFTASENTNTGKTIVHGIIAGIPVPFPVASDACKNMACPVKSGDTGMYINSIYCSPKYPKIKLLAKWEVTDDNGADLFCFVIPLEIQ